MKRFNETGLLLLICCTGIFSCQRVNPEGTTQENDAVATYMNPILDADFADPTPIKAADGYYYAYATNTEINSKTVNIQVAKSDDLVNWIFVGDALPQKPSWADQDFWAPHVFYDAESKTYYLYYSGESNLEEIGKCLGVATSQSPEGPFMDKGEPMLCGEDFVNIDPMSFDDPVSGKKYLYWGSGFESIKVQELADDRLSFKEESKAIALVHPIPGKSPDNYQRLVEGAWVVYRHGYYYMFYSGDNCCGDQAHYAVMVARAEQPTGPFRTQAEVSGEGNSVILERNARWNAPGHNAIVTDEAGQDWMIYHAIDTESDNHGRVMLMDKVNYLNGWPVVEGGSPGIEQMEPPVNK